MLRALVTITAAVAVAAGASAGELLPRPAGLEPNVRFWTRIYSEIDTNAGLIHDSEELDVVYETIRFPKGLSSRSRERRVEAAKRRIRSALRVLAGGKRSGLTAEQSRVLSRWPDGVSNATLRRASGRVRFQLGQADKFREGLIRAGAWRGFIESVMVDHGLPVELVAMPHVESSYNPKAYSSVGAAGMWQFTRSTGRRFLRVDHVVDERMDPWRSTEAAALLLKDNYRRLESWPLAITAYNHGTTGMARAARRLGTKDIAVIAREYRSRTFGFASRNFYAEFLAALDVDRNATRYFGWLPVEEPPEYDVLELDHYYKVASLESAFGVAANVLRSHNPALRPSVWNGAKYAPRGYAMRIPKGAVSQPDLALARIPSGERFAKQHRDTYYKVRRGDTLSIIARRYGVRMSELVALNNLRSRHRIRAGQVLILPDAARGVTRPVQVAREEPPTDGIYRVRRGDNLTIIATRFGVSTSELADENGLRNRNVLHVGQTLRLPGHTVQLASVVPAPAVTEPTTDAGAASRVLVAEASAPAREPQLSEPQPEGKPSVGIPAPEPPPAAEPPAPEVAEVEEVDGLDVVADADPLGPASPDPSNYSVAPDGRIVVQAEETLGHYAEWLEVRASDLRRLNRLRYDTPLVIGHSLRLDFSRVDPSTFEQRRLAYHQALQEEFFSSYMVVGTREHVLRPGETLWYLAERKFRVPVWLLRQYNPDLDFGALPAGVQMVIPEIQARPS